MGKKSKGKSNKSSTCYHGCTKKEFNNCGKHYKILSSYDKESNKEDDMIGFYEKFQYVLVDPTIARYVIARITDDFLKGKDNATLRLRLILVLLIRYCLIPRHEGKDVGPESEYTKNYHKYSRDIATERGRINCIAREVSCDCMEEKRIEAKSMEKVTLCFCCHKVFPKEKMLRCKGCNVVQYCSEECSIKYWPTHKEWCKRNSFSSAPTPTEASVPSFEESTDLDAGEE
eukprot:CAMPEP_0170996328 /NCGR_PEP_ID=MMETSP0736-20130129/12163_1 /TAXON_ID=186038 /ORGANISM="Fragilariopsis kerguelensis, Strain L26-C5" /LENGTH=229 /DNA_ID=CAMNT_0011422735 /DNA_START=192 /DNA_END=881 /DNA_ORIENTATION=+